MSSVYKKGRDGYYYYQTYVYNPETKKKDKRIFHALGTKDLNEAKKKQSIYDQKYDSKKASNSIIFQMKSLFNLKYALIITVIIFLYSKLLYETHTLQNNTVNEIISNNLEEANENEKAENVLDSLINAKIIMPTPNDSDLTNKKTIEMINTRSFSDISLPNYKIKRVEKITGAFNQVKIFAITYNGPDSLRLKKLCKKISQGYSDFDSIVICIYKDNLAGNYLAKGKSELVSHLEQKEAWLSMYTYNSVEGEYFDNNPTNYLNLY